MGGDSHPARPDTGYGGRSWRRRADTEPAIRRASDGGADARRALVRAACAGPRGVKTMRIVYFTHSLVSCWNHGNAHFLRGVLTELKAGGHDVRVFEPEDGWSRARLVEDHGPEAVSAFRSTYPQLASTTYRRDTLDVDEALD